MVQATEAAEVTSLRMSARGARRGTIFTLVLVILAATIGAFLLGVYVTSRDLANLRLLVGSLRAETQKAKQELVSQRAANSSLQGRLGAISAELEAIQPAKGTYNFRPNQSIVLADGRLTIGLVGAPGSNNVLLNVNGEQKKASTGDVIQVAAGPNATCRMAVQRFDLFNALINVTCSKAP